MDTDRKTEQEPAQPQAQVEDADTFEHIQQGSDAYDAQTYGMVLGYATWRPPGQRRRGRNSHLTLLSVQYFDKAEMQLVSGTKVTVAKCKYSGFLG